MNSKKHPYFLILFLVFSCAGAPNVAAQDFKPLVQKAWEKSGELRSRNFQLQAAEAALSEAKSLYGPSLGFLTTYTLAAGGRDIDFPIGDLLNPVYGTLNQLTATNNFPQVENQSIQFLPNNFYDARFRVTQPIYYPDLAINKKLKTEAIELQKLETKAYKRYVSKEVMTAFFQLRMSEEGGKILEAADLLLTEAARTTGSMIRNGIAIPSALTRIEAQMAGVEAQKMEMATNGKNAKRYLEYLVGSADELPVMTGTMELPAPETIKNGLREELAQIDQGIKMQTLALDKTNQFYKPRIGAQLELGSQAFDFEWNPYTLLGINFEMNLYDHKRHLYQKRQAEAEIQALSAKKANTTDQFALQTDIARELLVSASGQAKTWQPRIAANQKIYNETFRRYKEGTANYLELLDAQTQWTQSLLQYNLAKYSAWIKWADYLYVTAGLEVD